MLYCKRLKLNGKSPLQFAEMTKCLVSILMFLYDNGLRLERVNVPHELSDVNLVFLK